MSHLVQDRASLEMGRRVAAGLRQHPEWVALARENLARWKQRNADAPGLVRCYVEWEQLLGGPLDHVIAVLTAETDEGQRLRQNTPFAGVLSPQEVWAIKQAVREAWKAENAGQQRRGGGQP